jgi:hypothetical protein
MSFDKVKTEALKVEMGVTLVNGQRIDEFSDHQLIGIIRAERDKMNTLALDVGAGSKYYLAKHKAMEINLVVLAAELERRVA